MADALHGMDEILQGHAGCHSACRAACRHCLQLAGCVGLACCMVVPPDEAKVVFDAGYYAQLPRQGSRLYGAGAWPNWPCHPPLQPPLHTAANIHCRASKVCIANVSDEVICTLTEGINFGGGKKQKRSCNSN